MKRFWSDLYAGPIAHESVIGKIRAIEQLEKITPYQGQPDDYFMRVKGALESIPNRHKKAALLIFSSVIYFPALFLDEAWRHLWFELKARHLGEHEGREILKKVQFFEVDPSGMISKFMHMNGIDGRLDVDSQARCSSIDRLFERFCQLFNGCIDVKNIAIEELKQVANKDYWIILTDKALSGQSLREDLKRYYEAASVLEAIAGRKIEILVIAQIITSQALTEVKEIDGFSESLQCDILYSALLDDRARIGKETELISDRRQLKQIFDCCDWFVEEFLDGDPDHDRTRQKSGDNLSLGYRGCALTVVDSANCPTNSLPLLWYRTSANAQKQYRGPFPRTEFKTRQTEA